MLNDTRAILERLVYVIWMALTAVSIGLLALSPFFDWPAPGAPVLSFALGGFLLSRLLHHVGYTRLRFQEHGESLDGIAKRGLAPGSPEHLARVMSLRRVLEQWDVLEEERESGQADVWAIHALRREAQSLLRLDPELRAEFDHELSRRPGLRDR